MKMSQMLTWMDYKMDAIYYQELWIIELLPGVFHVKNDLEHSYHLNVNGAFASVEEAKAWIDGRILDD